MASISGRHEDTPVPVEERSGHWQGCGAGTGLPAAVPLLLSLPAVLLQHVCSFLPIGDALIGVRGCCRLLSSPSALPLAVLLRRRVIPLRHYCQLHEYSLPECPVPPALWHHIRALCYDASGFYPQRYCELKEVAGLTVAKPMPLARRFPQIEQLQLQHVVINTHEDIDFDTIFAQNGARMETAQQQQGELTAASAAALSAGWRLRVLSCVGPHAFVSDSDAALRSVHEHLRLHDNYLGRLLLLHSATLRELDIRLQTSPHGLSLAERTRQQHDDQLLMTGIVRAIADARLSALETLRLEYEQECTVDEQLEREKCGRNGARKQSPETEGAQPFFNFSQHSVAKASLMRRMFSSLSSLSSAHMSWFHPLLVLPFLSALPLLRSLTFAGLLTFDSLPWLGRCRSVQHLLIDFFVDEDELRREWTREPDFDEQQEGVAIQTEEEEAAAAIAEQLRATHVVPTHALPVAPSAPDAMRSADVDVSFFLFHALARLQELRSVQLQSTLQLRNCCRVDMRNFTLLQDMARLRRMQFACFMPPTEGTDAESAASVASSPSVVESLSPALSRLCCVLPQLDEIIVNIERREDFDEEDEDEDEDEDEEDEEEQQQDDHSSEEQLANDKEQQQQQQRQHEPRPSRSSALVPLPAVSAPCQLRKLGIWDGHAASAFSPSSSAADSPPCILRQLEPFLASYPRLQSLTLISCHVAQLAPLRLLAPSLITLCLFFTNTVLDGQQRDGAVDASAAVQSAAVDADGSTVSSSLSTLSDVSSLSFLTSLRWLILHGTGDAASCFTRDELVHLGSVVDGMASLRHCRIEQQANFTADVWHAWTRERHCTFKHLETLSLKDCVHIGAEGLHSILHDLALQRKRDLQQPPHPSHSPVEHAEAAAVAMAPLLPDCDPPRALLPSLLDLNLLHTYDDSSADVVSLQRARAALASLRAAEASTAHRLEVRHDLLRKQ